jgi:hypothetical protein
MNQY